MNFSLVNMNATEGYLDYNTTNVFYEDQIMSDYSETIIFSFVFIICFIGVPLNGIVIYLLGFQIKRNPFTVLILNLAIADFGYLVFMTILCIEVFIQIMPSGIHWKILVCLLDVTYINGLFLLTAISTDRCVAVLFPIWHHCFRPKYLSSAVCAFLWIFSFFLIVINGIIQYLFLYDRIWNIHLVVTAVLCLPLITTATMILFFKICLQSKQIKRGRLLVMIFITLLCFFILSLPFYIFLFVMHFNVIYYFNHANEMVGSFNLSTSLNSSINPVIYFLVGRKKRARTRESIKVAFQRVFREEEAPEI